jgi:hypothetical protein
MLSYTTSCDLIYPTLDSRRRRQAEDECRGKRSKLGWEDPLEAVDAA